MEKDADGFYTPGWLFLQTFILGGHLLNYKAPAASTAAEKPDDEKPDVPSAISTFLDDSVL